MKREYHFLIVTPSFNQGEYIEQTISSVVQQDADFTYFVADGGSDDKTVSILKKYSQKITWISEKDKGQTDAINKGIEYFKKTIAPKENTVYIFAYINSDDYYLPNVFSDVIKAFKHNPEKKWLVGEYVIETSKHQGGHSLINSIWKKTLKIFYSKNTLLIANPIAQPATFIRWEAVKKIGHFNKHLRYVMDYEYWLRLQDTCGNPIFLDTPLACFRIHETSKGGSQFEKQFAEQFDVAKKYTKNRLILSLHRVHNWLTIRAYSIMK